MRLKTKETVKMAESRFVIGEKRAKPFYIIGTILLILILIISLPTAKIFPQKKTSAPKTGIRSAC